jgi:hypothetical protein
MIRPSVSHRRFLPVKSVWNSEGRIVEGTLKGRAVFFVTSAYIEYVSLPPAVSRSRSSRSCGRADRMSGLIRADAF